MDLDPEKKYELFISIGYDFLYRINLNQLRPKPKSEKKSKRKYVLGPPTSREERAIDELADLAKLEEKYRKETELALMFSHYTHKQPDRSEYPLGMGLFVNDSKLHFFGGQNLEKSKFKEALYDGKVALHCKSNKDNWYNKKVFSFTPNLNIYDDSIQHSKLHTPPSTYTTPVSNPQLHITRLPKSTPLPNHIGYKGRPIVFTILDKVYAFATEPYSNCLSEAKKYDPLHFFEVFDPKENVWKLLPNPPRPINELLYGTYFPLLNYCVCNNKFILQTGYGQFVFDATKDQWEPQRFPYPQDDESYPDILASLEYKDSDKEKDQDYKGYLFVFFEWRRKYNLVAYNLASFGEFPFRFGQEDYTSLLNLAYDIDEYSGNIYCPVTRASLCLVKNNQICLVIDRMCMLHVCLLEVNTKDTVVEATVMAHQKFVVPPEVGDDGYIMSTFILENDPTENDHNQSFSKGELNSVFVSNLPCTITTSDILQEFELLKFGEIKPDEVFLNCKEDYAFVEFEDVESHDKAIEASPINFAGKKVSIEEVYKTSQSHLLWWRWRKQKKTLKKNKALEA